MPKTYPAGPEINAAANVLRNNRNENGRPIPLMLATAETFGDYALQLQAAYLPQPNPAA